MHNMITLAAKALRDRYEQTTLNADIALLDKLAVDLANAFEREYGIDRMDFLRACLPNRNAAATSGIIREEAQRHAATLASIPLSERLSSDPRPHTTQGAGI